MLAYLARCPKGTGLITTPEAIGRAIAGEAGTRFTR
jgi:carbamate kinase